MGKWSISRRTRRSLARSAGAARDTIAASSERVSERVSGVKRARGGPSSRAKLRGPSASDQRRSPDGTWPARGAAVARAGSGHIDAGLVRVLAARRVLLERAAQRGDLSTERRAPGCRCCGQLGLLPAPGKPLPQRATHLGRAEIVVGLGWAAESVARSRSMRPRVVRSWRTMTMSPACSLHFPTTSSILRCMVHLCSASGRARKSGQERYRHTPSMLR